MTAEFLASKLRSGRHSYLPDWVNIKKELKCSFIIKHYSWSLSQSPRKSMETLLSTLKTFGFEPKPNCCIEKYFSFKWIPLQLVKCLEILGTSGRTHMRILIKLSPGVTGVYKWLFVLS